MQKREELARKLIIRSLTPLGWAYNFGNQDIIDLLKRNGASLQHEALTEAFRTLSKHFNQEVTSTTGLEEIRKLYEKHIITLLVDNTNIYRSQEERERREELTSAMNIVKDYYLFKS